MGGFCLLVELHQKGFAPSACAAGLFNKKVGNFKEIVSALGK